jgi:hypothetical protein
MNVVEYVKARGGGTICMEIYDKLYYNRSAEKRKAALIAAFLQENLNF